MKILLSLFFVILSYAITGQEYFNVRFGFGFPQLVDGAINAIENNDGYVINGKTGHQLNPFWPTLGMVKFDFQGNIL